MLRTRVTELFGIKYPIVQGGIIWLARAELVAAVSNAGGLGILSGLTFPSAEELALEIRRTRTMTDKPFGVNIPLLPTLRPIDIDSYFDVIIKEGVPIVETAGKSPEPYMARLKAAKIKVMHKATAVRFAQTAQRIGCDAICIDGFECAGYPGNDDVTSLILVPLTADAVDIPVVSSGGFADGRGLVAALALGAEGILMGTRFMATQESPLHPKVREWLIQASERDTMLVEKSLGNKRRVLRNSLAEKVLEMESKGATLQELAPYITGRKEKELMEIGDLERGLLPCGQAVGLIRDIPSVGELIARMVSDAEEIIERASGGGLFRSIRRTG